MPAKNLQPLSNRLEAARGSSLAAIKTQQLSREGEERARQQRVRGTLVLISQFLLEQGYTQALQALQTESQVSLTHFTPADNIDLLSLVAEFEDYYEFKFLRRPKLYRVRDGEGGGDGVAGPGGDGGERMLARKGKHHRPQASSAPVNYGNASSAAAAAGAGDGAVAGASGGGPMTPPAHLRPPGNRLARLPANAAAAAAAAGGASSAPASASGGALGIAGSTVSYATAGKAGKAPAASEEDDEDGGAEAFYGRALRPLPQFPTSELRDLAQTIMREILDVNPAVRWGDIAELDGAKRLLKEAVVMPVRYPQLFAGVVRPWKGVLLFGPPGTGKTLLAKAVATECRTTFFNISASSVVSKWRGDSEKLVRMLFELAVHYSPSTIFIDELDSLMSARSSEGEHEGSRRMKTELLTQMDGLSKRGPGGAVVFVMAATNLPWDLDAAMLRRLEKKVLVPLPTATARAQLFRRLLTEYGGADGKGEAGEGGEAPSGAVSWERCAALTEGMSGADIDIVCREAVMRPVRRLIEQLEGTRDAATLQHAELTRPRVGMADVEASIACTRPSVRQEDLPRYEKWMQQYGSGISA